MLLSSDFDFSFVPSPNFGAYFEHGLPDTIVIHYTAMDTAEAAITRLSDPSAQVSAHLVIGRDGYISQLVSFKRIAWHAGISSWNGREGLNRYSIGIELDNAGLLQKKGDWFYSYFGGVYEASQVMEYVEDGKVTYWHKYSSEQIDVLTEVCALLAQKFPIKEILGHSEIAPERKIDPGPAFPMDRVRLY